jgi:hypothetical protein
VLAPRKLWKRVLSLARPPESKSTAADGIDAQVAEAHGTPAQMSEADAQRVESLSAKLKRLGMTQHADLPRLDPQTRQVLERWLRT